MTNKLDLKKILIETLKKDQRLWDERSSELNQTLLLDLVENIDEKIIDMLLQNKELRSKFFTRIKDVYVFNINACIDISIMLCSTRWTSPFTNT